MEYLKKVDYIDIKTEHSYLIQLEKVIIIIFNRIKN